MTDIATLRRLLASNRFMPSPPGQLMFCGDGDFRAIGAEFLERLVRDAGLLPGHRVLDIGSGVGRLALPMTQYLDETGSYDGVDPVAAGIDWCSATITPVYPAIRFHHHDVRHDLYNPHGQYETVDAPLPFADASFDRICMMSVLTHLDQADALHYAAEVARLLAPGGLCLATAFLINLPALEALKAGLGRIGFSVNDPGPVYQSNPEIPQAGVAFDEDVLLELFLRHGLRRRNPAQYGHWSGREGPSFQDICLFERV